ncbi:hypothetical protein AK812_SmicGene1821 [Symbiodinium microadriaticum]|uniref:Uncharacterized protein n=1 Tax=Symbiodinium microadriaticum TaxID=2951 RepID=A0A1Q9F2W2_SYMMI|nr:hypothetical protein AK812_SmicGene1821 [Symbiodinium microadriaticum]
MACEACAGVVPCMAAGPPSEAEESWAQLPGLEKTEGEACAGVVPCMAAGPPSEAEELLLWEDITASLRGAAEVDAAVLRLKLVLQLHRHGQGPPDGWNPEVEIDGCEQLRIHV